VRTVAEGDEDPEPRLPEPEAAPPLPLERLSPERHDWRVIRDLSTYKSVLEVINDAGQYALDDIGTTVSQCAKEWYSNRGNDFQSLRGEVSWVHALMRDDWDVRTETRTVMTCDATHFHIHATLDAFEEGRRVFERSWIHAVPRRCV